jgi:excisionase family DNA binding protein
MSELSQASVPTLFTIEDVAERLKVSVKTVRRMIARGELDICRFGRLIRVSETDLAAFIEQHH